MKNKAEYVWRRHMHTEGKVVCRRCGLRFYVAELRQSHPVFASTWCPTCRSRETVKQCGIEKALANELLEGE